jgi:hypothetical protein
MLIQIVLVNTINLHRIPCNPRIPSLAIPVCIYAHCSFHSHIHRSCNNKYLQIGVLVHMHFSRVDNKCEIVEAQVGHVHAEFNRNCHIGPLCSCTSSYPISPVCSRRLSHSLGPSTSVWFTHTLANS